MKSTMKYSLILLLLLLAPVSAIAQDGSDQQLAQHYYSNGEFDKALIYYEKLYDESPSKINF